ncbi:energy-coupling factor transporter transmembrane protein EcfT [Paenibacillus sp. SYP-B3998]|uniref:Energy-coupling factor transporter transmembrane protein EcfT n=1 Tax=Paenibacillus sp. SYP-B3998 TaxID=2678564 RepID=A0A6G3ZU36_9BACL|nr:energy-coupling factor transporter transmembrane component T [Paenibacillus sp. SYP-B3998]NEW05652.1 energy-coupling factor transporter transmembrane protein EcfT [Paenibacillus sp. SYP-B3998]
MTGLYIPQDSPLHRLNPLIKLIAVLPAILFLTLVTDPWIPLALALTNSAAIILIGGIRPLQYARSSLPMLFIACGITLSYSFLASSSVTEGSTVWFAWGPFEVYKASVIYGAATALRLYAMFGVTLMFVMTTEPTNLIRAMIQQWKLNEQFGYGTLAVFRFIPDLRRELGAVQAAHRVRGMTGRGAKGKFVERLRRYMVPLLAAAIRRAERTSYAMDARGFGSSAVRTHYRKFSFSRLDWVFLAVYWLITLVIITAIERSGWMGPLSFLKMFG